MKAVKGITIRTHNAHGVTKTYHVRGERVSVEVERKNGKVYEMDLTTQSDQRLALLRRARKMEAVSNQPQS